MTRVAHGILVPTGDVSAMAASIRSLTNPETHQHYHKQALRRGQDFDIDQTIDQYAGILENMLENG
jgi:hypothetical protein